MKSYNESITPVVWVRGSFMDFGIVEFAAQMEKIWRSIAMT